MPKKFTIITPYHFGPERPDDYARLMRSLRSSLREVEGKGRVILVANGTEKEAGDPSKIMQDLSVAGKTQIDVVKLRNSVGSVGGLNAGIEGALATRNIPGDDEWIGKVDSSAVLEPGWLDQIQKRIETEKADATFVRQLFEEDVNTIYSDGHTLMEGCTWDVNYGEKRTSANVVPDGAFPCLGACMFRRQLVEQIVREYGNFVCENLAHYGSCTDVALRAMAVNPSVRFVHCPDAVAHKRRPIKNDRDIAISQLLSAKFYYLDKEKSAQERIESKSDRYKEIFVDIGRETIRRAGKPYSLTGKDAPKATSQIDAKWGV